MKKSFLLVMITTIFVVLFWVVYFIYDKHTITQTTHALNRVDEINYKTDKNSVDMDNFPDEPLITMTNQMEQHMPYAIRFLTDEENITTTNNYLAPPKTIIIPKTNHYLHYLGGMDELSTAAKWPLLREVGVPAGSLEVRVWMEAAEGGRRVLRLCRHEGKWTGFYTSNVFQYMQFVREGDDWGLEYYDDYVSPFVPILVLTPQNGWKNLWKRVEELGILTLPDASSLPKGRVIPGGINYFFEINDGTQYRTYQYGDPKHQKWPEAEKVIQIIQTLSDEFEQSLLKHEISWL